MSLRKQTVHAHWESRCRQTPFLKILHTGLVCVYTGMPSTGDHTVGAASIVQYNNESIIAFIIYIPMKEELLYAQ